MRMRNFLLAFTSLAVAASAQLATDATDHVFHFTPTDTQQTMNRITNAIRTVAELRQASWTYDSRTLVIHATASDAALAGWIFQELDAPPPTPPNSQVDGYPALTSPSDELRAFRLAHVNSMQQFQEVVNAIRTIPEITKVFPDEGTWTVVARGSESQLTMAEWLFRQLDQPAAPNLQARAEQMLHTADARMPELRVIYFAHAPTPQAVQEIVNATRTVPELTHVFPVTVENAVAFRGQADRVAFAEWLFSQLDRAGPQAAPTSSAVHDVTSGADSAQVFFLSSSVTSESFQQTVNSIRTITQVAHVFPCRNSNAVTVRGTPEQLLLAKRVLRDAGLL